MWKTVFPYLLSGISVGGQYALIAIGYTMVYGILRLINFAHVFAIGFAFGIPALKWLLRWKKEKKLREAAAQAEQAQTVQKTEETDGAKTPENDKKG